MRRPCADRGENHDPADARHTRGLQNRLTQRPRLENLDTTGDREPRRHDGGIDRGVRLWWVDDAAIAIGGGAVLLLAFLRIEFLFEAFVGRFAGVDRAADGEPGPGVISPRHGPLSRLSKSPAAAA
jgi:hypothetical protein